MKMRWTLRWGILALGLLVAGCAGGAGGARPVVQQKERLDCWEGASAEPSCGGAGVAVYLRGAEVRRVEFDVEMSTRETRRVYEFEGGEPRTVVETIWATLDERGERLAKRRLLSTKRYELGAKDGEARRGELIEHARFLVADFAKRRKEFVRRTESGLGDNPKIGNE